MSTSTASESGADGEATAAKTPDGPSVIRTVGVPWAVALGFGALAYVGATNSDVSPTILGELIFGFLAVVLFLVGLAFLLRD